MIETARMVLAVNCGLSSLRFALWRDGQTAACLRGHAERLGTPDACIRIDCQDRISRTGIANADHAKAFAGLVAFLEGRNLLDGIETVGHRVVHGGERFIRSVEVTDDVLADIEACTALAPLHNPANLKGIRAARAALPDAHHVAVFETTFHQTIPPAAYLYALPLRHRRELGVRRYGFQGISHRFASLRAVDMLGLDPDDHGLVVVHLGEGASATAVLNGSSVDTSMGLTPTEGLVMATRSGDVDIGAILYVARARGMDLDAIETMVNLESGLFGLSELSSDGRVLEKAAAEGHAGAREALEVFIHRAARTIGGLAATLPRLDAIVFTGRIGENSAGVRAAILSRLTLLGLRLDEAANLRQVDGREGLISQAGPPAALVIAADEERMIALDAVEIIRGRKDC